MRQKGITLVEIIVSMVVLSLILLGVIGMFVSGKTYLMRAQYKQTALHLAREKLEELEALDFDADCLLGALTPGVTYPTVTCPDTGGLPSGWSRSWTIIDDAAPPNFKRITVTVQWQEP
ncbi:MAG: prepilin-type N-terminal cleavage/methylation domain-containing protein [Candidatus Omnitrophota bacterium]